MPLGLASNDGLGVVVGLSGHVEARISQFPRAVAALDAKPWSAHANSVKA